MTVANQENNLLQIETGKSSQVTNYPKFLREIELYGRSSITQMEERVIDFPENLEDFFDKNPEVCS